MNAKPRKMNRETAGEGASIARALTSRHVQFITHRRRSALWAGKRRSARRGLSRTGRANGLL